MPKAARKSSGEEGDESPFTAPYMKRRRGSTVEDWDNIVIKLGIDIKEEVHDTMKEAILDYKLEITIMVPGMDMADLDAVWRAIKDKVGLCICHQQKKKKGHWNVCSQTKKYQWQLESLKQ